MGEEYQYLNLKGERVFSGLHRPTTPANLGVVMCHPLGEEKLWAHRVFVSMARDLAARGVTVLRFDFRGEGDSERDFRDTDLATRVEDTGLAIETLRESSPSVREIAVVGLRFGAAVAVATAIQRSDVARLILWDPIIDGAEYMQAVLRLNLMYQMALHRRVIENREALVAKLREGAAVNIEGYELTERLFRQASEFRLYDALSRFPGDVLLVQVDQVDAAPRPNLVSLAAAQPRCRVTTAHEDPFWREIKPFYQKASELTRVTFDELGLKP
jgi:alpha/beta superfamily hydrolase